MASNEHVAGGEHKGVVDTNYIKISKEEYSVLKAKADLYDEYTKQSRFYTKLMQSNPKFFMNQTVEDDGK